MVVDEPAKAINNCHCEIKTLINDLLLFDWRADYSPLSRESLLHVGSNITIMTPPFVQNLGCTVTWSRITVLNFLNGHLPHFEFARRVHDKYRKPFR